jgi:hypothetical protein
MFVVVAMVLELLSRALIKEILELRHEGVDVFESAINRGEPNVGDLVQFPQLAHDELADLLRRDLVVFPVLQLLLDCVDDLFQSRRWDGAFFTGFVEAGQELGPIELDPAAVTFDHHVGDLLDALVRGEPASAFQALPPPANGHATAVLSGVHHPILVFSAERASHAISVPGECLPRASRLGLGVQANIELQLELVGLSGSIQIQLHIPHLLNQPLLGILESETQGNSMSP